MEKTHLLIRLPKTVDGKPFNAIVAKTLFSKVFNYDILNFSELIAEKFKNFPGDSYWFLMEIPTCSEPNPQSFRNEKKEMENRGKIADLSYSLPRAIETVSAVFAYFFIH